MTHDLRTSSYIKTQGNVRFFTVYWGDEEMKSMCLNSPWNAGCHFYVCVSVCPTLQTVGWKNWRRWLCLDVTPQFFLNLFFIFYYKGHMTKLLSKKRSVQSVRCTWFHSSNVTSWSVSSSNWPPDLLVGSEPQVAQTGVCVSLSLSLSRSLSSVWGEVGRSRGQRSREWHLPSLCVGGEFTGADDQHSRWVQAVQSHLRVKAEPGHQVLQVGPRLLPPLPVRPEHTSKQTDSQTNTVDTVDRKPALPNSHH